MAQQTSGEWLENEIYKLYIRENGELPYLYIIQLIKQAKEMHKAECISFCEKWESGVPHDSKEDLYDEIFKNIK